MSNKNTSSVIVSILIIAMSIYFAVKVHLNKASLKKTNNTELLEDKNIDANILKSNNETPILADTTSNYFNEPKNIKLIQNKKIDFNGNNFIVKINCEIEVYGECKLELIKNNKKISSKDFGTWMGNIQD